jgi:hypothetical protein
MTPHERVFCFSSTTTIITMSEARDCLAATSVGNLVLFGGGQFSNGPSNVVDVFNVTTSNKWTTATLSQARYYLSANIS